MAQEVGHHPSGTGPDARDLPGDHRQVGDRIKEDSLSAPSGFGGFGKSNEGGKLSGLHYQKA